MARGPIFKIKTTPMHLNVPVELHALLKELAGRMSVAPSRFVTSLLAESIPTLQAMNAALALAQSGKQLDEAMVSMNDLVMAKIAAAHEVLATQ